MKKQSTIILGTLGPEKSSSEAAAYHYYSKFITRKMRVDIHLYATFDSVLDNLIAGNIDLAIIPHAYEKINHFYINPALKLKKIFAYSTPPYGLYKKIGTDFLNKVCQVVSHPAPVLLVDYLLKQKSWRNKYKLEFVNSTSIAAQLVYNELADLALTNERAAKKYMLEPFSVYGEIEMGWSAFSNREV